MNIGGHAHGLVTIVDCRGQRNLGLYSSNRKGFSKHRLVVHICVVLWFSLSLVLRLSFSCVMLPTSSMSKARRRRGWGVNYFEVGSPATAATLLGISCQNPLFRGDKQQQASWNRVRSSYMVGWEIWIKDFSLDALPALFTSGIVFNPILSGYICRSSTDAPIPVNIFESLQERKNTFVVLSFFFLSGCLLKVVYNLSASF